MSKNIAVLGAQVPDYPYDSSMGYRVGNIVAKMMQKGDVLITGGVEGVGCDTFMGFAATPSHGTFSCFIPEEIEVRRGKVKELIPYKLPIAYKAVSAISGRELSVIQKGKDMFHRRELLAAMVDMAIVLNGGPGTLHEAEMVLEANTPLIALIDTGGVAELLYAYAIKDWDFIDRYFPNNTAPQKIKNLELVQFARVDTLENLLSK